MTEYNKTNPFPCKLAVRTLLSKEGSTKKTYHIKLDLTGSKMRYTPGDAIGIFPENPHSVVESILSALKKTGKEKVVDPRTQGAFSLRQFLQTKANLIRITSPMLKQFPELQSLTSENAKQERMDFVKNHDLEDLFKLPINPKTSLQELLSYISPMLPRFYSIASSQHHYSDSVDLLVVTFKYMQSGKMRCGLGSQFLCEFAKIEKTPIPTYHHPNRAFKLPKDPKTPIIMIGPGTGVAPYRAFLQERLHQKAEGKNWLFFGERQKAYDFYYEDFFSKLEKESFLRLNCAFSRDQEKKIYVQDHLKKHARELWEWIQNGAVIYICGDAHHMAKDVTATLHSIAQDLGHLSDQDAKNFIRSLRKEKRLLLDVY